MSDHKNKSISFGIARTEVERYLIEKYGFPEDTIITNLARPVNQASYILELHSEEFPEIGDFDQTATVKLAKDYKYV